MFLKNGFGKMNITSFNNAHLATDLKSKQNNMWQRNYYNPSLIANDENENVDNSIDSGLNDDLLEKDKNTGLQQKDNKLDNHDKKPNNKNNFFKNNSNSKGDVLKKLFGKKGNIKLNVFSLKTKLILCGIGGGVFLLFIILLTLFTSNNGADLDLVNNYKESKMMFHIEHGDFIETIPKSTWEQAIQDNKDNIKLHQEDEERRCCYAYRCI